MPVYRIFRLRDHLRQSFRTAPHVSGLTTVKQRDYVDVEADTVEAPTPYAAWFQLRESANPLGIGDLLEAAPGELRIVKYVGFEEAKWFVAESKSVEGGEAAPIPAVSVEG